MKRRLCRQLCSTEFIPSEACAIRRPAVPRRGAPATAAKHAVRAPCWPRRIVGRRVRIVATIIPVRAPLPHVSMYVVWLPGVGGRKERGQTSGRCERGGRVTSCRRLYRSRLRLAPKLKRKRGPLRRGQRRRCLACEKNPQAVQLAEQLVFGLGVCEFHDRVGQDDRLLAANGDDAGGCFGIGTTDQYGRANRDAAALSEPPGDLPRHVGRDRLGRELFQGLQHRRGRQPAARSGKNRLLGDGEQGADAASLAFGEAGHGRLGQRGSREEDNLEVRLHDQLPCTSWS